MVAHLRCGYLTGRNLIGPILSPNILRAVNGLELTMGCNGFKSLTGHWRAELAHLVWAVGLNGPDTSRPYMGRLANFYWASLFHQNGPLLRHATCQPIIGASCPMSGWHLSQRWADTGFLQLMMILHVENPHWSGLLTGYRIQNQTR